ncbi:aminoglycoside phosphotransferase (APT) family kinase protein [Endobacter medicaginis]|uniref:Aminoglycoside phosphotransferase (APT) family kinase protein n=1 Tax=Endobacter medicaginis TaxID=1181271 RepID=A0A850NW91_9PROT|nr:phosphotransferase family protein [Endobacter medicaginis]MBB3174161.1 aminoglycoside phosphotransferase (APT) family kinase protein [Endobacter medicaginis]MCX5474205.1 phosphotransferase family protein [Endobacter medicaginis]NVN30237.1 phosphotransferase family protein [Endobacter medicaginis]
MNTLIDTARAVRDEDRIDIAALDDFLKAHVDGLEGVPEIRQFAGGASNLTYLVRYGDREMVLRRPPAGVKAAGAHDMLREAAVMTALRPVYPLVPQVLARSDDASILGAPFFVMERIAGIILRRDLPAGFALDADGVTRLCENFVEGLVALHSVDTARPEIAALGRGEGYVGRQVAGWTKRWRDALTEGTDAIEDVTDWLAANQPARETRICVIHNDYRLDNVVLDANDPLRIIGVLDWEMATLGDPLMDLGGSLAYWVEAGDDAAFRALRRQPSQVPGMLTRAQIVQRYGARTGIDVSGFTFYEVFGLFRLMGIAQQIWRRFVLGQTTNPQFAGFGEAVRYLGTRCRRLIAENQHETGKQG